MLRVVFVGVVVMLMYWAGKQALGGVANGLLAVVALFVAYLVCTQVLFIDISKDKLPEVYREPDKRVEEKLGSLREYEYRDVDKELERVREEESKDSEVNGDEVGEGGEANDEGIVIEYTLGENIRKLVLMLERAVFK